MRAIILVGELNLIPAIVEKYKNLSAKPGYKLLNLGCQKKKKKKPKWFQASHLSDLPQTDTLWLLKIYSYSFRNQVST